MASFEDVIKFLDENSGKHSYGKVAEAVGLTKEGGGRAVGSMMKAIHRRGLHGYCERVVSDDTGEHGCDYVEDLEDDENVEEDANKIDEEDNEIDTDV